MSRSYNIRWRDSDTEELARVVKNFNAKLRRLAKSEKFADVSLPPKMSVKEIKNMITTRADYKRELNAMKRFTKRGAEQPVTVPENPNKLMTKWQRTEIARRVRTINRRRAEKLEEIKNIEMVDTQGRPLGYLRKDIGLKSLDERALEPMEAYIKKMSELDLQKRYKAIMKESGARYWDYKTMLLRDNFIKGIQIEFKDYDIDGLVSAIKNMDFNSFYNRFLRTSEWEFVYAPNETLKAQYVEKLKAIWIPNTHTMSKPSAKERAENGVKRIKK